MRTVKFTEDFATKTKGEVMEIDSLIASQLVNVDKVAIYTDIDNSEMAIEKAKTKKAIN